MPWRFLARRRGLAWRGGAAQGTGQQFTACSCIRRRPAPCGSTSPMLFGGSRAPGGGRPSAPICADISAGWRSAVGQGGAARPRAHLRRWPGRARARLLHAFERRPSPHAAEAVRLLGDLRHRRDLVGVLAIFSATSPRGCRPSRPPRHRQASRIEMRSLSRVGGRGIAACRGWRAPWRPAPSRAGWRPG